MLADLGTNGAADGARRGRPPGSGRKTGRRAAATSEPAKTGRKGKRAGMGRRPKGEDLGSVLVKVLQGASKPMTIPELVAGAKKAGYASSSPSFSRIVGMRLGNKKMFKRVARGQYSA